MKKIIVLLSFVCSLVSADINIVVSIIPQKIFVEAIGGDKVTVSAMVQPGDSPHTYEPKPSQMISIAQADAYFTIGVEFEKSWMSRIEAQNKKMRLYDLSSGVQKMTIKEHHHGDKYEHEHEEDEGLDPHIWVSPVNVRIIAKNIYEALMSLDAKNSDYYTARYDDFLNTIDATDKEIKEILFKTPKGAKFMVFHPSWGYFARDYNLEQLAIEAEGKEPKPKQITHLLTEAKEEQVRAIFASPEFSDIIAKQIAKELNIPVLKISPLASNWSENLIEFAKAIAKSEK
jgi:zinc transport system substrate-binding protein